MYLKETYKQKIKLSIFQTCFSGPSPPPFFHALEREASPSTITKKLKENPPVVLAPGSLGDSALPEGGEGMEKETAVPEMRDSDLEEDNESSSIVTQSEWTTGLGRRGETEDELDGGEEVEPEDDEQEEEGVGDEEEVVGDEEEGVGDEEDEVGEEEDEVASVISSNEEWTEEVETMTEAQKKERWFLAKRDGVINTVKKNREELEQEIRDRGDDGLTKS
jgi:hypothetical protein